MLILLLASDFPYPPDSGGRIKTLSILDYLRRQHEVRVLCFRRRDLTLAQARWAEETGGIQTIPLSRGRNALNLARSYLSGVPLSIERNRGSRMAEALAKALRDAAFDAVFVDGWLMAQYLPEVFGGLKLLHEHNAEHVIWRRQADAERNPLLRLPVRLEYRRVRRYEASILRRFDAVFAVSRQDRQALIEIGADPSRTHLLPNLPDPSLLQLPPLSFEGSEQLVLYFGTLSWQPNLEGLSRLLGEVWPLVRERLPGAQLAIAGRDAPPWLQRLARATPGVEFPGPVDDAETLYRRARVFAEITRSGGGTKLKILNAMARGLPVVATPEAIEGIDAIPGTNVLTGVSPLELAEAVARLMTDAPLWRNAAAAGRALVSRRYTVEAAYRPLDEVLGVARARA